MKIELHNNNHFSSIHIVETLDVIMSNTHKVKIAKAIRGKSNDEKIVFTYKDKLVWIKAEEYDFLKECLDQFKSFSWGYACGARNPFNDEVREISWQGYDVVAEGELK